MMPLTATEFGIMLTIRRRQQTSGERDAMGIAVGTGLATYPFSSVDGFWRWIALCEDGGIDSIWQTDTLVSREPMLE